MNTITERLCESPVLLRSSKLLYLRNSGDVNLEKMHLRLLGHLRKTKVLPIATLTSYLNKINEISPTDSKSDLLIKKIKGLLLFILKRRAVFTKCIINEEIVLLDNTKEIVPETQIASTNTTIDIPLDMISNTNFLTQTQSSVKMEMDKCYSPDLFSGNTIENLRLFSQQNYEMMINYTQKTIVPQMEEMCQIHETIEEKFENYNTTDTVSMPSQEPDLLIVKPPRNNIFNNINPADLYTEIKQQKEIMQNLQQELVSSLINMKVEGKKDQIAAIPNGSRSLHSEENYRILKETCKKYKAMLAQEPNNFLDQIIKQ